MWPFSAKVYPALRPQDVGLPLQDAKNTTAVEQFSYDYIIVGGGTAGCCLAARLSEDPTISLLLLERGPVQDTWVNNVPLLSADTYKKDSLAQQSKSEPLVHGNNRTVNVFRGEALGGGSRINAMLYTRGVPGDYNQWRDMGHPGWSYENLLPYFTKSENSLDKPESFFHGATGPWENQTFTELPWGSLPCVKEVAANLGIPFVPDCNSPHIPSASCAALNIATDKYMHRASTFHAFLPASIANSRKDNLKICTDTLVTKLVFDKSLGPGERPRAVGVEFADTKPNPPSKTFFARARREIIICCGALGTPQLLLLSGVGPAAHLKTHNIPVVLDSPGVGSNLKDHVDLPLLWHVPLDDSLHVLMRKPWRALFELAKYIVTGKSLLSHPFVHMAIFLPTRLLNAKSEVTTDDPADLDVSLPANIPDIEVKPIPVQGVDPTPDFIVPGGAFTFMVCLLHPKSVGSIRLRSADPYERPKCDLGLLSHQEDITVLTKGIRLALRLAAEMRAKGYPFKDFLLPASESDEGIEAYIRANGRTTCHYSCSCRMAPFDHPIPGVVDDELRVHGIDGLRLSDTSISPEIISAHTMALAVVIAEKCADMVLSSHAIQTRGD